MVPSYVLSASGDRGFCCTSNQLVIACPTGTGYERCLKTTVALRACQKLMGGPRAEEARHGTRRTDGVLMCAKKICHKYVVVA